MLFPNCFLFSVKQRPTVLTIIVLINLSVITGIYRNPFCERCRTRSGCRCRGTILDVFAPYVLAETSRVEFAFNYYFEKLILWEGAVTNTFYNNSGICAINDMDTVPDTFHCQTTIEKVPLFDHIKHLEITRVPYLTFFSKNALSLFPKLETLTLTENIRLTNVPALHADGIKSIT